MNDMTDFELTEFLPQQRETPYQTWSDKEFGDRIEAEFGLPLHSRQMLKIPFESEQGEVRSINPATTWMYIPGDSVERLSSADDVLSVFFDIVAETHSNFKKAGYDFISAMETVYSHDDYDNPLDWIRWNISIHARQPFRGIIADPQKIFSEDVGPPGNQSGAPTNSVGAKSITIEKVVNNPSGRLARDIVKYKVSEPDQLFGSTYGRDFEMMVRCILDAGLEPASVNHSVEFDGEIGGQDTVGIFTGL